LNYKPEPIDTSKVELSKNILDLTEQLAQNVHNLWAKRRMREGWSWGPELNEADKKQPNLVPYEQLPESEKDYDRTIALQTIRALIVFGYRIEFTANAPPTSSRKSQ
jgi:hypothetical protein